MITPILLEQLADLITREADVKTLHNLEPHPTEAGRFVYLIETPFESWPRFVCGTTDSRNERVSIETQSGRLEACKEAFAEIMGGKLA